MHITRFISGARSTNDLDQVGGVGAIISPPPQPPPPTVPTYRPAPDYQTAVLSKYGGGVPPQLAQLYSSQPSLQPSHQASSQTPEDSPEGSESDANKERPTIDCPVCGDLAIAHFHYGGMCCYSCKAFFRRVVNTSKV